jgi:hypothetical protein
MSANRKNILLLSLVHPDFLPPVYAMAQVLRDLQYKVHILTFDSYVPAELDLGENITIEMMGRHYDSGVLKRLKIRKKFARRAKHLANDDTLAIISFCPFSFLCGLKIKGTVPLFYIAIEIADFFLKNLFKSPLSNYRNLLALKKVKEADFVATPSVQRSAWLAGRCHLDFMPFTILNTSYISENVETGDRALFKEIVPLDLQSKKIILYTGAVNSDQCILQLAQAFDMAGDQQSALIITGMKENEYCGEIKGFVSKCSSVSRILLLPYVTRVQMLALQSNCHIGVCLSKERDSGVKSKIGEYLANNLYVIGSRNEYLRIFEIKGFASLAASCDPGHISQAIISGLENVKKDNIKVQMRKFVKDYFCMQRQMRPAIKFIQEIDQLH